MKRKKKNVITLDDIAAETGCTKSTVSITLRNLPRAERFSKETRDRIHAAAERMGYRPNLFAQQLADKKPRMLMIAVSAITDPFAMMVIAGFEAQASEMGLRVLITALQDQQDPLALQRDILGVHAVPALALVGGNAAKLPDDNLRRLADTGLKIMLVNRKLEHPNIGHVHADEFNGGSLVARHIYEQGLRDVWIIGGMPGPAFEGRMAGILSVAKEFDAPAPRIVPVAIQSTWERGADMHLTQILNSNPPPQAMVALADSLALGTIHALRRHGLDPGRDVAVTGYDDGIYAAASWPPLTTVRLPMKEMGRAAASGLMKLMDDDSPRTSEVVLPVELKIRETSRITRGK